MCSVVGTFGGTLWALCGHFVGAQVTLNTFGALVGTCGCTFGAHVGTFGGTCKGWDTCGGLWVHVVKIGGKCVFGGCSQCLHA